MKVAFSKVNITPKEVIGKSMAGYTRKDHCRGKLDDLNAYGVLIETNSLNKEYLLLISIDTLKIPLSIGNYFKKKITTAFTLLNWHNIIIHATHTHSSLDLTGEFYWPGGFFNVIKGIMFGMNRNDKLIIGLSNKIVNMVKNLFNNLEPCKISLKSKKFNSNIVINRRHPERKTQPNLTILVFKNLQTNQLNGILINYSCHPTTLSFKNNKLSADYPGRIIYRINELSNQKISTIYFNGPSGDLNPITTCGVDFEKLSQDKSLIYDQLGNYNDTKRIGNSIANEALKLAKSIPASDFFNDIEFQVFKREFLVPMKDYKYFTKIWFVNKLYFSIKKYFILKFGKVNIQNANFPIFLLKRRKLKLFCESLIQFIKLKALSDLRSIEFGIMTIPGELFEDIGKHFIRASPTKENTFIFQNSQDWIGYLFPIKEYIQEGGYEPVASFSPLCGYYIIKEMKNLLNTIRNS
ncbi:MAG: neutral/alkaline non-lysosomal ceramidase N-terminal domain-containing protein [Promethearchaeota archaeon]